MVRLECDYNNGAHPAVLQALVDTNDELAPGYGEDEFCETAQGLLQELCAAPGAAVHFVTGGTQANAIVLASMLRPYQGVLSADSGHIACHETGAIEATGHKVLPLRNHDGRISAWQVRAACAAHKADPAHEHLVQPGAVYISHPTEMGTLYTHAELKALRAACDDCGLLLYLDGARLGYGLAAENTSVNLAAIAKLCDAFTVGGTKLGLLFGEAIVVPNRYLQEDFRYIIKQRGGMLAKGRLLGVQFAAVLREGLYMEIGRHAVAEAMRLRNAMENMGVAMRYNSPTNQQFPVLPDEVLEGLAKNYAFTIWERAGDGHSVARFCTSWSTATTDIDALIRDMKRLLEA